MNLPPLSRQQIRRVDQIAIAQYGMPGVILMENAGRGAAEAIDAIATDGLIVVLAGKGNNAGDGYVIARHLQLFDRRVRIVSMVDPTSLSGDALINAKIAIAADFEIMIARDAVAIESLLSKSSLSSASVIVDCLLGTGATGPLREPFASAVRLANQSTAMRVAIDVPTGLDCDSGELNDPTFRADHTLTFVAEKLGFAKAPSHVGQVEVISIGVPQKLLREVAAGHECSAKA